MTPIDPLPRRGLWWKGFAVGFGLWILAAAVTFATRDPLLMPTLILIGSFLVPSTVAAFAMERATGTLTARRIASAFAIGGVGGVLAASLLESRLADDLWVYVGVGVIEELVKGVIVLGVGLAVTPKSARLGACLGAAVGAGFAAFESAGYAYSAALGSHALGVVAVLQTEALRAALAPAGHVLWTAILGAVLFEALRGPLRPQTLLRLVAGTAGVVLLHALWDSMGGIAQILAMLATGAGWHVHGYAEAFAREAGPAALSTADGIYWAGLAVVAAAGLLVLRTVLRHAAVRPA